MVTTRNEWLNEISRWKLEAAEEDNGRYFYGFPGVSEVQSGENSYVLGRKGAGKTAIAEHIRGLVGPQTFARSLSFKNFPFNELYKLDDKSFTSPSQYTTIWKHLIYSAICSMMADNAAIDPSISAELAKYFSLDVEKALAKSVSKISEGSGGFTVFGTGFNTGIKKVTVNNSATWQDRTLILEELILSYVDASNYYIIFDELDEDYKDVFDVDVSAQYLELIISLFKAVQDVRRKMRRETHVRPLVFLRSDIYELLNDNDKNKWRDSALDLTWSEAQLRDLTAFRLSRALHENGKLHSFNDVIDNLFTTDTTRAGGARRQRHVFAYILAYTLRRPRDVISYLRECARFALANGNGRISPNRFSEVNRAYSFRMRQEFVDEMQGAVPSINRIFEIISTMRKQIFSLHEFEELYNSAIEKGEIKGALDFRILCNVLFHYSVIGNQPSQRSAKIYKYIYPTAQINFLENVVLHPGLLQSLQIN